MGVDVFNQHCWGREDYFQRYPHKCVLCGRPWRPDKPYYIGVHGVICRLIRQEIFDLLEQRTHEQLVTVDIVQRDVQSHIRGFPVWYAPSLGIVRETGLGEDHIRYVCHEHADEYVALVDCFTNERVTLILPPTPLQRAWQDVRYWARTTWRFVWGLVKYGAYYASRPVRGWSLLGLLNALAACLFNRVLVRVVNDEMETVRYEWDRATEYCPQPGSHRSWWRKPKHVDRLAEVRRKRFKHIGRTAARRGSFRRFWREVGDTMTLAGQSRRMRRRIVLRAWRQQKG